MAIWFPLALTGLAAIVNLRTREIPNLIPAAILAGAFLAALSGWLPISWRQSLAGAGLAFALGCLLFWINAWGGGDVKLLAALGAWLGPAGIIATFLWIGILGAALALASAWRGRREFAMGPAIAGGLAVHLIWPLALVRLMAR